MINTTNYVIKQIEERDIRFLRLWFTDILGQLKNVAITPSDIEVAFDEGVGIDASAIEGLASRSEFDLLVHPDASTFQTLPWRPKESGVARMFCDVRLPNGAPAPGDSRHILMETVKRAAALGYSTNVGMAIEYFCFKDSTAPEPVDRGGYFDLAPLDSAADLRRDAVLTLEQMGIPVEYSHHEAGPSQQEIDLRCCDALSAADAVMTARVAIKQVAGAHGCYASFMPKPIEGETGSAMHVHMSLFNEMGVNAFFDANDSEGFNLSSEGKHFIAGLLKYAPEFTLVTNQYVNSYKRFVPGFDAPMHAAWGACNPTAMVRLPVYKPSKASSMRVAVRSVDSAANPYLALAVILGAGLRGIEECLELCAPVRENLFDLSHAERVERGIAPLPTDLNQAIEKFESSQLMREILGGQVHESLVAMKRAEWESYRRHVSSWDHEHYLATL